MVMHKHLIAAAAFAASLGSTSALAVDNGIYVGASVGESGVEVDLNPSLPNADFDDGDTAYKLNVGWRILDWVAVEANYVDLGSPKDTLQDGDGNDANIEFDADGINFSGLLFLPVGPIDLFARAGFISWDASLSQEGLGEIGSDDGMDFSYGAGAQFRIWSLTLRAEYERFDIADADTVDMVSVGLMWTFL
jgi:Outer membrane protein beta-barrel domain